jgi:hypothetical protein
VEVIDDLGKCIATAITSYQKDFEELSNNDFMRIFCNQQVKTLKAKSPKGRRYHLLFIRWCINVMLVSPSAYNIIT